MKKMILGSMAALSFLCALSAQDKKNNENKIRLLMPPAIYAVPGHEMNLYFDNVVLVPNMNNYIFDAVCSKGRQDKTRWRFTPTKKDIGKTSFALKVLNGMNKVVSEASSELCVTAADAGQDRNITMLIVGDSLTDASRYPNELNRLLQAEGNPKVKFIGSHAGAGRKPDATHIPHEGRGGWTWKAFCDYWKDLTTAKKPYRARSPFLFVKEGKPQLDFKKYCEKYNDGKAPDFITVFLGCNDNFGATDETIDKSIDRMFKYADILVAEFRKVSKDTEIGLILTVPPAATQNAFGSNYKCGQTRWQYRRNQHRIVERMIEKYGKMQKENIFLIPAYINIDCENNFPKKTEQLSSRNKKKIARDSNGVHPAKEGYYQIADSVYCWLKHRLNQNK